jgi:triosephosphate isomerase
MSRKKIVAGNWKMNKTLPEAIALTSEILEQANSSTCIKIILPPFPFIHIMSELTKNKSNFCREFFLYKNCFTSSSVVVV